MARDRLLDALEAAVRALPEGPVAVALSGGLDSSVLLHTLAGMPQVRARGLRAIHIDHGLQAGSDAWLIHCQRLADACGVTLLGIKVLVGDSSGIGPEDAARRARHDALRGALQAGEILAFGHHRDDQAETVLLKLMRAAGPQGLGAMRVLRGFGAGLAWRPLLDLPRAALHAYAQRHALDWIEDPSNTDTRFDRNYLRRELLPGLRQRWPEADSSLAQSAQWAQAASDFIDQQARLALARIQGFEPTTLRVTEWLALPLALRDPVLRQWLRDIGMPQPTWFQVAELLRQIDTASEDRLPCVSWSGTSLRRYRDLLYACRPMPSMPPDWRVEWDGRRLELPAAVGTLQLIPLQAQTAIRAALPALHVRFRHSGERVRLAGESHHRPLRDVLQSIGVPPWQRGRLPLLVDSHDRILAIADLCHSEAGAILFHQLGCRLDWRPAH